MKDIMPSMEIDTGLLPYLLLFAAIFLLSVIVLWYHKKQTQPEESVQSQALHRLKQLDFEGEVSPELLYRFSIDTQCYLDGRKDPLFEEIQAALLPYKYRTEVPEPDSALIQKICRYIKGLA